MPGGVSGSGQTSVAYNSVHNEYLVANGDYQGDQWATRINPNTGALIGTSFMIYSIQTGSPHWLTAPAVTLSAGLLRRGVDHYIWPAIERQRQRPIGGAIQIATGGGLAIGSARLAYNPDRDEFLVLYQQDRRVQASTNLYARRVRASDGALVSSIIPVAAGNGLDISVCPTYVPELAKYGSCGRTGAAKV